MKSKHLIIVALIAIFAIVSSCITDDNSKSSTEAITPTVDSDLNRPLNISVFLDLSDRLDRDLVPSQFDRDTAIIGTLVQLFMEDCIHKGRIINSENHFQIFFHPVPKSTEIATLASGLNFDMSSTPIAEKKKYWSKCGRRFLPMSVKYTKILLRPSLGPVAIYGHSSPIKS